MLSTFGSSPREPGAWLVARADGQHRGSLSGGCVEEDFLARLAGGEFTASAQVIRYGEGGHEVRGSPCRAVACWTCWSSASRPARRTSRISRHCARHSRVRRRVCVRSCWRGDGARALQQDSGLGERVEPLVGPYEGVGVRLRAQGRAGGASALGGTLAGGGSLAAFAVSLGFEVIICEPREEVLADWDARKTPLAGVTLRRELPSRFIAAGGCHAATAVVALTHDPRIDDLAMIEAVRQPAFYIGVMGSQRTSQARAERLARSGGLSAEEIEPTS